MALGKNPSPKPSTNLTPPSGSSSHNRIKGIPAAETTAETDPSKSGDPAVVQQRTNAAMAGTMLHKQLKKNKSRGIRVP